MIRPPSSPRRIFLFRAGLALAVWAAQVMKRTDPGQREEELQDRGGFTNTLGMTFIPVPGTDVLWCEHETRVRDYAAYAAARLVRSSARAILLNEDMEWRNVEYEGHKQTGEHPVVYVSWEDAKAFCAWLSEKEGCAYRLPTDHEWSIAVGIGAQEDPKASPEEKNAKIPGYPWGAAWPPPPGYGNFPGSELASPFKIEGYRDPHPFTAPVKSYPSTNGLFDLSGNDWEWCEDLYSPQDPPARVLRGGSWAAHDEFYLRSSNRNRALPTLRDDNLGFRCVVSPAR